MLKNYSQEYQWLFPINESVAYKTHNGYILHNHVKAKIIHTYYLYTDIDNDTCTHMLLYLDRPLVANYSIRQVEEVIIIMMILSCDSPSIIVLIFFCHSCNQLIYGTFLHTYLLFNYLFILSFSFFFFLLVLRKC